MCVWLCMEEYCLFIVKYVSVYLREVDYVYLVRHGRVCVSG